ncbi:hypothetical protein [Priestia aryabhattai]
MTANKITKRNLIIRSIFVVLSLIILVFIWNHFFNKPSTAKNVYSLNTLPFKSDSNITFHKTTLKNMSKLDKSAIIMIDKEYMLNENKKTLISLAENHHTIIFYDKTIVPEEVVSYMDGIVPVVPINSSIPLKFQAYGVTTIDDSLIPVFVSVTTDQKSLNEKSFKELIKQVAEKTN